jgi:adenosylcobinamide-phosphate synthase
MPVLFTLAAFVLDWILGDPQSWPHPVRLIGRLIKISEQFLRHLLNFFNKNSPLAFLLAGAFLSVEVPLITGLSVWLILYLTAKLAVILWVLTVLYLVFSTFCLNDLLRHSRKVEQALKQGDLPAARKALSWIVGRDTALLEQEAIRRAVIETLAENFSDGLVAPFFYLALGGPVLVWVYKAVNTLDSMVGYKDSRYLFLGRCSARLDDVLNFIPSRLAAFFLIMATGILNKNHHRAFLLWKKEGRFHSSPNSGQTEAAMAGALNVFLGGPSRYCGLIVEKPFIGKGGGIAGESEVKQAESLVTVASLLALLAAFLTQIVLNLFTLSPYGWGLIF